MSFDSRIGIASLIVGLLGIGITIVFPQQKWIGWLFIGLALLGGAGWGLIEYRERSTKTETIGPSAASGVMTASGASGPSAASSGGAIPHEPARKNSGGRSACGPIPTEARSSSGGAQSDSATTVVTRGSSASGATIREFSIRGEAVMRLGWICHRLGTQKCWSLSS